MQTRKRLTLFGAGSRSKKYSTASISLVRTDKRGGGQFFAIFCGRPLWIWMDRNSKTTVAVLSSSSGQIPVTLASSAFTFFSGVDLLLSAATAFRF